MGHKGSVLLTGLRGMLVRMALSVRKAGRGVADCLLGQTKCKQMCCVIKMMQQERSSLFCRRPLNHGNAQHGDLLFSCPQQRTHTTPHMYTKHTLPQPWNSLSRQSLAPLAEPRSTRLSSLLTETVDENKYSSYLDFTDLTVERSLKTMKLFRL